MIFLIIAYTTAFIAVLFGYSIVTFNCKIKKIRQLKVDDSIYVINYDKTDEAGVLIYEKCKIVEVRWDTNNKLDSVIVINQSKQKEILEREFVMSSDFVIPIKF